MLFINIVYIYVHIHIGTRNLKPQTLVLKLRCFDSEISGIKSFGFRVKLGLQWFQKIGIDLKQMASGCKDSKEPYSGAAFDHFFGVVDPKP